MNKEESTDHISKKTGNIGEHGIGGKGGPSNKRENGEVVEYFEEPDQLLRPKFNQKKIQNLPDNTRAKTGNDGEHDKNEQGIGLPEK